MNLILILGDQLTPSLTSLRNLDAQNDVVLMCELRSEATYAKHHKKKIALIFSAMRHFAQDLRAQGVTVQYVQYDDPENTGTFTAEITRAIAELSPSRIKITEAGEYRLAQEFETWRNSLSCPVDILPDDRFIASKDEFVQWTHGRKQLRMEFFYREMRRKTGLLMEEGQPIGGQWNFDAENRQPPKDSLRIPAPLQITPDDITRDVLLLVEKEFSDHFGDLTPFEFAVTRADALKILDQFIDERLADFGTYQDAMLQDEPWMFHSHISFYLNCGLLTPLEVCRAAERAFHEGKAPLNAVEGFIRQIIGWREYVHGLYWLKMPEYKTLNAMDAQRKLPALFWNAETKMNCMRQCILETKKNAYAHHIQRLMVIGNFSLLAGLHPDEVNNWYLLVYADAFEWVELPNVSGMVLFADNGIMASKPYAASGAYINKMSNYCKKCSFSVTKKNGPSACPFNYLYWNFLDENAPKLRANPRLGLAYRNLDRMTSDKRKAIRDDSMRFLKAMDNDEKV